MDVSRRRYTHPDSRSCAADEKKSGILLKNVKKHQEIGIFFTVRYDMLYKSYIKRSDDMAIPEGKHAWTATVGEKGQIVIHKQARNLFDIKPGDTLLLLGDEKRGIAIPNKGAFAELFYSAFEEEKGGEHK